MEPFSVETMRRAHTVLQDNLRLLQAAVQSSQAAGLVELRAQLGTVRQHVAEHFRLEEQNGYMDVVRKRQPRLERTIEHLAAEHMQLMQAMDTVIRDAGRATGVDDGLCKQVTAWVESVHQHEDRENQLIEDAFDVDLGPGD